MVQKSEILEHIRDLSRRNSGVPPGQREFAKSTGIGSSAWRGKYWARWSDAVVEAGFEPQKPKPRFEDAYLLDRICKLAATLGRFPTGAELLMAKRSDPTFPHANVVKERFGSVAQLTRRVSAFAKEHPEHSSVVGLCALTNDEGSPAASADSIGWVYLVTDGRRYKVGRTHSLESRIPELAYQNSRPIELVHKIETDDPVGIENYWLTRFAAKKKYSEWFELDASDVAAFRKRKRYM